MGLKFVERPAVPERKVTADKVAEFQQLRSSSRLALSDLSLAQWVEEYLLTIEQRKWLDYEGVTVFDLMRGIYTQKDKPTVTEFFAEWNTKIGHPQFLI